MTEQREFFGFTKMGLNEILACGETAGSEGKPLCQYEVELKAQTKLKRDAFIKGFTRGCMRKLREIRFGK